MFCHELGERTLLYLADSHEEYLLGYWGWKKCAILERQWLSSGVILGDVGQISVDLIWKNFLSTVMLQKVVPS